MTHQKSISKIIVSFLFLICCSDVTFVTGDNNFKKFNAGNNNTKRHKRS